MQDHVVMRHKEERPIRVTDDSSDRQGIREAIASCINVFDVGKHPENTVLDIFTGRVIGSQRLQCGGNRDMSDACLREQLASRFPHQP